MNRLRHEKLLLQRTKKRTAEQAELDIEQLAKEAKQIRTERQEEAKTEAQREIGSKIGM